MRRPLTKWLIRTRFFVDQSTDIGPRPRIVSPVPPPRAPRGVAGSVSLGAVGSRSHCPTGGGIVESPDAYRCHRVSSRRGNPGLWATAMDPWTGETAPRVDQVRSAPSACSDSVSNCTKATGVYLPTSSASGLAPSHPQFPPGRRRPVRRLRRFRRQPPTASA